MDLKIAEIPEKIGFALQRRADVEGKTLDQVALEALAKYAAVPLQSPKRDLSFMGKLSVEDARAIDEAHEFCDQIGHLADSSK